MLAPFLVLPQVDQGDVSLTYKTFGILCADRPAFAGHNLLRESDAHIGRNRDVHHFRVWQL